MKEINDILVQFDAITLKEMDHVKLMDRTDTKFIFSLNELERILYALKKDYKLLEVEQKKISRYKTLYYDTANFKLYNKHHNKELNRYKIRHRRYVESNAVFLEVKFKNNKGRSIKNRVKKMGNPKELDVQEKLFLEDILSFNPDELISVLWVNYSRLTLVSNTLDERLTIDLNLEFVNGNRSRCFNTLVFAEVKQENKNHSIFIKLMKSLHIPEGSISKYCLGIAVTYDSVKINNFKEKLLTIKKIMKNDFIANNK